MAKITYTNKVTMNENADISAVNKIRAADMNEIKNVVNGNDDLVGDLSNLDTTNKSSIVEAINELAYDSGWIDVTDFGKNITYYDPYNRPRYRKIGKVVYLQGYAKTTAQFPAGAGNKVTLFTLPVGYRPAREITAVCQGSGMNRWVFQIGINGEATMDRYGTNEAVAIQTNAWLAISSVSFLTN